LTYLDVYAKPVANGYGFFISGEKEVRMQNQELLTVEEMAAYLKVPPSWIYARTRLRGSDFPVIKCGKYCRFDPGAVMKWIERQNGGRDD